MIDDQNKKIYLVRSTNEDNNAFVGVRIRKDSIEFHYPESYDLSGLENEVTINNIVAFRRDMIDILNTISLAKTRSSSFQKTDNGVSSTKKFSFMSYLWIIRDYINNGYYKNKEKTYRNNTKGRINWKKTLNTQPIISKGNIIYNNIVAEVTNECDSIIEKAHRLCVYDSIRKVGWLFGINEKAFFVASPTENVIKQYIVAIKNEIKNTFDDLKKVKLSHMLKVLSGVDNSKQLLEIVYGVDKYHYIYERMIDSIFGNVSDIKQYNPNATWYIMKDFFELEKNEASSLRPDTIRIDPYSRTFLVDDKTKTAYVLDAKYYRFGTTGKMDDLPETTSIQKQVTYATHIEQNIKEKGKENIVAIHNAFILPYNKKCNCLGRKENLEYIGFSRANWQSDSDKNVIHAFLIDTKHLISSWSRGNSKEDIDKLIEDIDKFTSNHKTWTIVKG